MNRWLWTAVGGWLTAFPVACNELVCPPGRLLANDGLCYPAQGQEADADADADADTDTDSPVSSTLFQQVSAGGFHTCAVDLEGAMHCWGHNREDQSSPPAGEFVLVSSGVRHSCGLLPSNEIECWGFVGDEHSQPPEVGTYDSISIGASHGCGVDRAAGFVRCWGWHKYQQDDVQQGPLTGVTAGGYHTCALEADGSARCWGVSDGGEQDKGQVTNAPAEAGFVQIAAGFYHTCGLDVSGAVTCWGSDDQGQASPPDLLFETIEAGGYHNCGVTQAGEVACWGLDDSSLYDFGQVRDTPGGTFVQVSAGGYHTCALDPDDLVHCWGWNGAGQSAPDL